MKEHLTKVCCRPGAAPTGANDFLEHAQRFKALSEPARVAIVNRPRLVRRVARLRSRRRARSGSADGSRHHLRVLREAGLIEFERRGTCMHYRLVPPAIDDLRLDAGAVALLCVRHRSEELSGVKERG